MRNSKIEWTNDTWNVINGCSVTSPGCTNCYAMRLAGTRLKNVESRKGLTIDTKAGPVWNGTTKFNEPVLLDPLRWKRPRRIFVCAHGDLFHKSVPDEWIDRVFAVMALAPQHQFQVLTKRSARMRSYVTSRVALQGNIGGSAVGLVLEHGKQVFNGITTTYPAKAAEARDLVIDRVHNILPNVWLGVSVEDQKRADERIPDLLATPAAVRWLSCEPLLRPVFLRCIGYPSNRGFVDALTGKTEMDEVAVRSHARPLGGFTGKIDWVIAGGESGPGARPMHPDWARSLRDQCAKAGVPFLFKQHGEWIGVPDLRNLDGGQGPGFGAFDHRPYDQDHESVRVGKKAAGRHLDGVTHDGFPA